MPYNPSDHVSVHSRPRPIRIAFLIDVDDCSEELRNEILRFNVRIWGGRLNPIIPVVKGTIPPGYWNFLFLYDPDIVYSYVTLSDELIKKIDSQISPYHLLVHKILNVPDKFKPQLSNQFLNVDFSTVPIGVVNLSGSRLPFLICQNQTTWPQYLFFQTNFGVFNDKGMHHPPSDLDRCEITENLSVEECLKIISEKRGLIFPWQHTISEVPIKTFHANKRINEDAFTIVLGDSIWNWLYMWNRIFIQPKYKQFPINQFYFPSSFINNDSLTPFIRKLISLYNYRTGSHSPIAMFASCDIDRSSLQSLAKKFTERLDAMPGVKELILDFDELLDPSAGEWFPLNTFSQHDYVSGKKFFIKSPTLPIRGKVFGEWMVDLKIEYDPQKFAYTNLSYWWKLPRVYELSRHFVRNVWASRINGDGALSVGVNSGKADVGLSIPSDRNIITALLIREDHPYLRDDVRNSTKSIYDHIQISDKGRYLNGYLGLVGNLFNAGNLIEHHFWRTVFESMCEVNTSAENQVTGQLKNRFMKWISDFMSSYPEDEAQRQDYMSRKADILTRLSLLFARRLKKPQVDMTFPQFLKALETERQAFEQMPQYKGRFDISKERNSQDLRETLETLTALKILLQGIKSKCSKCGFHTWIPVDSIETELTCDGCQSKSKILPEAAWVYRLNYLVQDAIRYHGTFALAWSLSKLLLDESKESFIYVPPVELKDEHGKSLAEIDIACVSDGKFLIGEVKTKANDFSNEEIHKLCTAAKNVMPSQIVIGAFDPPYNSLEETRRKILSNLSGLPIKVRIIHPSEQINDPEYYLSF